LSSSRITYICYYVVVKRTTIFLPERLHEQLRRCAFHAKISMAELIRLKLQDSSGQPPRGMKSADPILKVAGICRGPVLSEGIDESLYGQ